jgi:hypothetical protein
MPAVTAAVLLLLQLPPLLLPQPLLPLLLLPPLLLLSPQVLVAEEAPHLAQSHCAAVPCLPAYETGHCPYSQT